MELSAIGMEELASIQNALQMTMLRSALSQNGEAVGRLLEGMEQVSRSMMENSLTPYIGGNIDITV